MIQSFSTITYFLANRIVALITKKSNGPKCLVFLFLQFGQCILFKTYGQTAVTSQNVFIITLDGFRWQEVFQGADPEIIGNTEYVSDTTLTRDFFWDDDLYIRRQKLLPFFWSTISHHGQLYGNRQLGNRFNVKNWYKISYPGYNELFTGYSDPAILFNLHRADRNINILEFLNAKKGFEGKVVAFSSWSIFPYILNRARNNLSINSGYDRLAEVEGDPLVKLINSVSASISPKNNTRYDRLTFLSARQYIEAHRPKVVFIGFGETDEFAHQGRYDLYLQKAADIDKMIGELWYYLQSQPFYKNKTTFIITTDHGRGATAANWSNHSFLTAHSGETWLALLGPGIAHSGEMTTKGQGYQNKVPATVAYLLGTEFHSRHHIGGSLIGPLASNSNGMGGNYPIVSK